MKTELISRRVDCWCVHDEDDDEHLGHLFYDGNQKWRFTYGDREEQKHAFTAEDTMSAQTVVEAFIDATPEAAEPHEGHYGPKEFVEVAEGLINSLATLAQQTDNNHTYNSVLVSSLGWLLTQASEGQREAALKHSHEQLDINFHQYLAMQQSSGGDAAEAAAITDKIKAMFPNVEVVGVVKMSEDDEQEEPTRPAAKRASSKAKKPH